MDKSIFISKNASEVQALQDFGLENHIDVKAHSFLHFEPIAFQLPSTYNVIFFGSPRAVMFFQSRYSISPNTAIASVGGKTTALLQNLGYEVAFNGEGQGSISAVAEAFQLWLGERIALFPVSTKSLGTISKGLSSRQAIHVTCYDTQIQPKALHDDFDTYVFSSPSNVQGFFDANILPENAQVIAWGDSTATALEERSVTSYHTLSEPSVEALIAYLKPH